MTTPKVTSSSDATPDERARAAASGRTIGPGLDSGAGGRAGAEAGTEADRETGPEASRETGAEASGEAEPEASREAGPEAGRSAGSQAGAAARLPSAVVSPSQWRAGGQSFAWRGHRIFYREQGDGEALLLLHGFPTSSWDWRHIWDELVHSYRVVAFDYLGFGFSDKPSDGPYSVFAYADQAEALLARLGIARVHVLAHDLGDTVAQELLARRRERADGRSGFAELASVCLLNGGIFPELHRARAIQKLLASPLGFAIARLTDRGRFGRGLAAVFGPRTQPSKAELDGFWECASHASGLRNYHRLIRYMRERRRHRDRWVAPVLAGDVPLSFVCGHLDPVSGKHVVDHVRTVVPGAEIHDLPEIGHYPQTEAPGEVLRAYAAFRQRVAGSESSRT